MTSVQDQTELLEYEVGVSSIFRSQLCDVLFSYVNICLFFPCMSLICYIYFWAFLNFEN